MPNEATPGYEFLVRNSRTLELIGEFRPQDVIATWTRRDLEAGAFRVVVPRDQVDVSLVALHNLIEVRRDVHDGLGFQSEFVGVIDYREVDEFGRMWTLEGMDLLGFWLSKRIVGATAAIQKSGPAETVLKAYVSENLGSAALPERRAAAELTNLTWDAAPSSASGNAVDFRAVRADLLAEVTVPVCRLGNLTQTVVLLPNYAGYEYRTALPVDATVSGGGLPFSVSWDNVEELAYMEDFRGVPNVLYVLGDGSGDSRNVTEVTLPTSISAHFRRESAFDARYANTLALRTNVGETELDRLDQAAMTVRGKPLRVSGNARYREDWDVGTNVTIALPQIGVQVDRRIVSTTVSLTRAAGEDVTFELGVQHSQSVLRRVVDRLRQLNAAANA